MIWPREKVLGYNLNSTYIFWLDRNYSMRLLALFHFRGEILQGINWFGKMDNHQIIELLTSVLCNLYVVLFCWLDQIDNG